MGTTNLTFLNEHDLLRRVGDLEARGLSFLPMTHDEIVLSDRLISRGALVRDGRRVRLPQSG